MLYHTSITLYYILMSYYIILYYFILYHTILYYILYCIVLYCAISILLSSSDDLGQVEGKQIGANSLWIPQSTSLLDATCPYQLDWLLIYHPNGPMLSRCCKSRWPIQKVLTSCWIPVEMQVVGTAGTQHWDPAGGPKHQQFTSRHDTVHYNHLLAAWTHFLQLCCTLSQLSFWLQMILMYKSIELASFPV